MNGRRALRSLCRHCWSVVSLVLLVSTITASCVANPSSIEFSSSNEVARLSQHATVAISGVTVIPSEEDGADQTHMTALSISVPVDESQPVQNRIDDVIAQGGIAIINHPKLLSDLTAIDLQCMTGYSGIEIYNGFVAANWPLLGDAIDIWDAINTYRAETEADLIWGFGADDGHRLEELGKAFVVAKALNSDTSSVLASLRNGSFYSSTGVAITDIEVVGCREIVVTLSEESTITFTGKGGTVLQRTEQPSSSAVYRVQGDEGYVRVEVDNPSGKAWTQPMPITGTGVIDNPYAPKGKWLKGIIHCHSIESDGTSAPHEIVDWCSQNGYSFLVITDHNRIAIPT